MLTSHFCVSSDSLARSADELQKTHARLPRQRWESQNHVRTQLDAVKFARWQAFKKIEEISSLLKPESQEEILIACFVAPLTHGEEGYRNIENDVKMAISYRAWASLIEPHFDGLTHSNLLLRINRNQLSKLEKIVHELNLEHGFSVCGLSRPCDLTEWSDGLPRLLTYCAKNALNLDRILSFRAWLAGRRWIRSSRSSASPIGFIPANQHSKNPLISKGDVSVSSCSPSPPPPPLDENDDPKLNTNDPRYYNFEWSEERRNTRLSDEKDEWEGRLLNDELCTLQYAKTLHPTYPDLIDKSGLPNNELPQKYIDLIKKALESRDESILVIAQASLSSERDEARKKAEEPQKLAEKRIKTVLAAFLRTSKAIRTKSKDKAIFAIAQEINNAVNSEDREALAKYGLNRRNALVFCPSGIKIISQEIHKRITEYDGESETEQKKIMREINNKLRPHLHCLMFAELHIFIQKFREKSQLFTGEKLKLADEILQKIDEKIGAHRKATCQGHWLKRALKKAMNGDAGRLGEMLEEIDFRSDQTRAQHGRKPLKNGVVLVEDNSEVKARQKTKNIRKIELLKAAEAAEKSAQPRVRKPRQPRKKPDENAP